VFTEGMKLIIGDAVLRLKGREWGHVVTFLQTEWVSWWRFFFCISYIKPSATWKHRVTVLVSFSKAVEFSVSSTSEK